MHFTKEETEAEGEATCVGHSVSACVVCMRLDQSLVPPEPLCPLPWTLSPWPALCSSTLFLPLEIRATGPDLFPQAFSTLRTTRASATT